MFLESLRSGMLPLIKELSDINYVTNNFKLVGGTALALYFGHRISVDIDLFSDKDFDLYQIENVFLKLNGKITAKADYIFNGTIEDTKIDFLKYPYKLKESSNFIEKIQLGNLEDIIPMKIMSLSQRGLKKDFSDVFEILNKFQLVEVKSMIQSHYGDRNIDFYHLANAFTYFDDAENGPDIESINNSKWPEIKAYFVNNRKRIIDSFLQE